MNLPDINFVDVNSKDIEQEIISAYQNITGRKLHPGNPERLFLEAVAYIIGLQKWHINYSAKQNLLAYAKGDFLDHLGALVGVARLDAQPARVNMRFYASEILDFDIIIPKGTRVTPDGNLFFETEKEAIISAGETSVDVWAVCEESGTKGNGYIPGQINILVDPLPYINKVENTTTSLGGADIESDEHLRERIRFAPESFSNAGSKNAYIFHTMSAHPDIKDVAVYSPIAGKVRVLFLLKNGEMPDASMIDLVQTYLSDEKVRPLTDQVEVLSPTPVYYDISVEYYITKEFETLVSQIETQAQQVVDDYVLWQKSKIGRDILPEELIKRLKNIEGIYRVNITSPQYTQITIDQVAMANNIQIQYGGVMDD